MMVKCVEICLHVDLPNNQIRISFISVWTLKRWNNSGPRLVTGTYSIQFSSVQFDLIWLDLKCRSATLTCTAKNIRHHLELNWIDLSPWFNFIWMQVDHAYSDGGITFVTSASDAVPRTFTATNTLVDAEGFRLSRSDPETKAQIPKP